MPPTRFDITIPSDTGPIPLAFLLDVDSTGDALYATNFRDTGLYEPDTTALLLSLLRPGDVYVDIGAHIGYTTTLASRLVGPSGHVIAFEPNVPNFRRLAAHVALNGCRNVELREQAVGDHPHADVLFLNADWDLCHSMRPVAHHPLNEKTRANPTTQPVDVTTLDLALGGRPAPKLIKMDVEGFEPFVLRGAVETLANGRVPYLIAEFNAWGLEQAGSSGPQLRDQLFALGYRALLPTPDRTAFGPVPYDDPRWGAPTLNHNVFFIHTAHG